MQVCLVIVAVAAAGLILDYTRVVAMPLVFGFFLALLVRPLQKELAQRLPHRFRSLSYAAAMSVIVVVLLLFAAALYWALSSATQKAPDYQVRIEQVWDETFAWAERHNIPVPDNDEAFERVRDTIGRWLTSFATATWSVAVELVLIFFFTLLLLVEAETWRDKIARAFRPTREAELHDAARTISGKLRTFLWTQTVISVISAVAEGVWLWAMGVDFYLLWALLFFVLNYLPNIGSVLACIPPTLMALLQFGAGRGLLVILGLVVLEQILGNYIAPRMQGNALQASPSMLLASLILWSWIWGVSGAILAVPITIAVMTICAHFQPLKPVAILLSRKGRLDDWSAAPT